MLLIQWELVIRLSVSIDHNSLCNNILYRYLYIPILYYIFFMYVIHNYSSHNITISINNIIILTKGTFASNLSRNVNIELAIQRAIYCASISVTKKGAQISYPSIQEIKDLHYHPTINPNSKQSINNDIIDKDLIKSSYVPI